MIGLSTKIFKNFFSFYVNPFKQRLCMKKRDHQDDPVFK
ncbi:hypothetical protein A943_08760 [Bacillus sp. CPSM8]|nr:hypothetical protein A943_08760 [Bacillus sp. CPSM8]KUL10054.1 hypothetical protein LI7559_11260 [Bacillus licheniformis LMG 7559]